MKLRTEHFRNRDTDTEGRRHLFRVRYFASDQSKNYELPALLIF